MTLVLLSKLTLRNIFIRSSRNSVACIGKVFHDPQVLHYGRPKSGIALKEGITFTIEPMINQGKRHTRVLADGWTATKDRKLSAQWEHTILVTPATTNLTCREGDESFLAAIMALITGPLSTKLGEGSLEPKGLRDYLESQQNGLRTHLLTAHLSTTFLVPERWL